MCRNNEEGKNNNNKYVSLFLLTNVSTVTFYFFSFFVRIISLHAEMLINKVVELAVSRGVCPFFSGFVPSVVDSTPYTHSREYQVIAQRENFFIFFYIFREE